MEHTISQVNNENLVCQVQVGDRSIDFHVVPIRSSFERMAIWSFYKGGDVPKEAWAVVRVDRHGAQAGEAASTSSFVVAVGATQEEAKEIANRLAHPEQ